MFPEDGKYKCRSIKREPGKEPVRCDGEMEMSGKAQVFNTQSRDKEITIVSDDVATLPKTRVTCPKCQHSEAFYVIRQTRAADEPETMIYRCCKCNYNWREY